MIDIIFVCMLNQVKKEIKIEKIAKGCVVYIDAKQVGSADYDVSYCNKLATKVENDMTKKGFKCEPSVKK